MTIPAQGDAPKEVLETYTTGKYSLTFADASKSNPYEYAVIKPGSNFDITTASWRSVNSSKPVNFTKKSTPAGSVIYVRYKGAAATSTGSLKLPSRTNSFTVKYTATN